METLVTLLMVVLAVNFLLKASFWAERWASWVMGAILALFVVLAVPYAILQSKTQIADFLQNTQQMLNVSVLIAIEAFLGIAFCFVSQMEPRKWWQRTVRKCLYVFSGVLIFVVLFYLLTQVIFAFSGVSFNTLSYLLAAALLVGFPLLAWGLRLLIPEAELRLELYFFTNLIMLGMGVVATVNGQTAVDGAANVNLQQLLVCLLIVMVGAGLGLLSYRLKLMVFHRKNSK